MSDPILDAAKKQFDEILDEENTLNARAAEVENRLAELGKRKKELEEFFRLAQSLTPVTIMVPTGKITISTGGVDVAEKSYKALITTKVESLLRIHKYLSTRAIVGLLEDTGMEVRGHDTERKILRTSVLLNKDGRFKADRRVGWSLKKKLVSKRVEGAGQATQTQ
jgi:hypothetical protein